MPKIIENLENRLIEEAKRQVLKDGYSALTIRSVATGCGVGVGTVYNYYPSKDALVASFMLQDWNSCIAVIEDTGRHARNVQDVLNCIYAQLNLYTRQHEAIFRDEAAAAAFCGSFSRYHALLRSQLAAPLQKFCSSEFTAQFVAEALLTWTMAGKSFDEIYSMIRKLF